MATERQQTARQLRARGLGYSEIGAAMNCGAKQAWALVNGYSRVRYQDKIAAQQKLLREALATGMLSEDLRRRITRAL